MQPTQVAGATAAALPSGARFPGLSANVGRMMHAFRLRLSCGPSRGRVIAIRKSRIFGAWRRAAADDASLFSRARWGVGIIGIFDTSSTLPRFAFRRPLWWAFRSREEDSMPGRAPALLGALCAGACRDSEFVDFSLFARSSRRPITGGVVEAEASARWFRPAGEMRTT